MSCVFSSMAALILAHDGSPSKACQFAIATSENDRNLADELPKILDCASNFYGVHFLPFCCDHILFHTSTPSSLKYIIINKALPVRVHCTYICSLGLVGTHLRTEFILFCVELPLCWKTFQRIQPSAALSQ